MDIKRKILSFDYILLILVCALSVFGIVVIGSARHIYQFGFLERQMQQLAFASGLVLLIITSFISTKLIAKFFWLAYIINIGLLVYVLFRGETMDMANVTRAIRVGPVSIQPSEFAKVFMIVYVAGFINKFSDKLNNFFVISGFIISIIIPTVLVQLQPSMSASLVVLSISLIMIFLGGISYKYILGVVCIVVPLGALFITDVLREVPMFVTRIPVLRNYHIQDRIIPFIRPEYASPDVRRQTLQSVSAIGSGQLTGKGLFNGSVNQLNYLAANHNDFIFAVIGEEFGFIGGVLVILILFLVILKCMMIAYRAETQAGRLIASGVGFMLAFQTFVNIGVATDILPNTGMALPFISYGGSSMWVNMIAIGLVIGIGISNKKEDTKTFLGGSK
ncbi:MAG: FtsW/RodA/SpoVE family cell cycle protein [Defluviitaleaceae bacterium]|nr:FtsW/RodA/SpoVE family cell cycle protein [Defluviitaleaceae bacterium]